MFNNVILYPFIFPPKKGGLNKEKEVTKPVFK